MPNLYLVIKFYENGESENIIFTKESEAKTYFELLNKNGFIGNYEIMEFKNGNYTTKLPF